IETTSGEAPATSGVLQTQEEVELKPSAELPTVTIQAEVVEEKPTQPTSESQVTGAENLTSTVTVPSVTVETGETAKPKTRAEKLRERKKPTAQAETETKTPPSATAETGGTTIKVSEAAPAPRRVGSVEASKESNPDAGEDSALEGAGITKQELGEWKKNNKKEQPKENSVLNQARQLVNDLFNGAIPFKTYLEKIKKVMPSKLMDKIPAPATFKEIIGSIDSNKLKIGIVGLNKFVKKGTRVGLRIDIPAFNRYGKNVVTVHDRSKSGQQVVGYGSVGSVSNVKFTTRVGTALNIGLGEKSKEAFAMAEGDWMDESEESILKRAEEALNSPEWVQVSMNPAKHSFFYDKADGNPVMSADEVIQVGNLVLAKNPKKIDISTEAGMKEFEKSFTTQGATGPIQYRRVRPDIQPSMRREAALSPEEAYNIIVDKIEEFESLNMTDEEQFNRISQTKEYAALSPEDRVAINNSYKESGVSVPSDKAETTRPKQPAKPLAVQEQIEFPVPVEKNDENINALIELKNRFNSLPKKEKMSRGMNLLNKIKGMAKDMGLDVKHTAGFNIKIWEGNKVITKRGVDRTANQDINKRRKDAIQMGIPDEMASEYVYDNDLVSEIQDVLSEIAMAPKSYIEDAILELYEKNKKEEDERGIGQAEMEFGEGPAAIFMSGTTTFETTQEEKKEEGPTFDEDQEFSPGLAPDEEVPFRKIEGPTSRKGFIMPGKDAAKKVAEFLKASGINVIVLSDADYRKRAAQEGFAGTQGVFISKKGEVIYNEKDLNEGYGDVLAFHEGIHPVINIIRNTNPKLYQALVGAINKEAKTNK
ncbi:MAG: hypothetical protein EBR82_60455, partial [Caulobacteraceae bacterium]|nr:hypothetical protein [Caulobacteraceae bacterium]